VLNNHSQHEGEDCMVLLSLSHGGSCQNDMSHGGMRLVVRLLQHSLVDLGVLCQQLHVVAGEGGHLNGQ
jgi:hypothetical protein